jgi:hypothetical protein
MYKVLVMWLVQCYNGQSGNQLEDVVFVRVFAETEKEAMEKSQKYVAKNHYRLAEVTENVDPTDLTDRQMRSARKQPYEKE